MITSWSNPAAPPIAGFDNPLGLMMDCHRRIERFLDQLIAIAEGAGGAQLTSDQAAALDRALRYFAGASPLHNGDEEQSLFPRLRRLPGPEGDRAAAAIERLETEHRDAGAAHAEVERLGRRWLAAGRLSVEDAEDLLGLAHGLRRLYLMHIATEDGVLFPLAAERLGEAALEEVGREMAARRGLDYDDLPREGRCAARRRAAGRQ